MMKVTLSLGKQLACSANPTTNAQVLSTASSALLCLPFYYCCSDQLDAEQLRARLGSLQPQAAEKETQSAEASAADGTPVELPIGMRSFSDANDSDLASALSQRISQISSQDGEDEAGAADVAEQEPEDPPLTGVYAHVRIFACLSHEAVGCGSLGHD